MEYLAYSFVPWFAIMTMHWDGLEFGTYQDVSEVIRSAVPSDWWDREQLLPQGCGMKYMPMPLHEIHDWWIQLIVCQNQEQSALWLLSEGFSFQ